MKNNESEARLKYEEKSMNIEDLVEEGKLKFAEKPVANPDNFEFESYSVPLIGHDYPAKTPVMWNAVYENMGLSTRNIMMVGDPENSARIFEVLRNDKKYLGGGAGVGFKDKSGPHLDEVDAMAMEIGAINFILKTPEGKLKGFNTDGIGYAESLLEVFRQQEDTLSEKKVVILGAGGTSNSIAFALAEKGARIIILNRTIEKARSLADKINKYFDLSGSSQVRFGGEDLIDREVVNADVIVNVSTKGAFGDFEKYSALAPAKLPASDENLDSNMRQSAETFRLISSHTIISDIVLRDEATPFLKLAKEAGFTTLDGIPMVINQAVEAFWLAHGEEAEKRHITKADIRGIMQKAANDI